MKSGVRHKKGFTLVETVLVLAVAGLIFAIVFSSLPALQVSSRDTQRKTDILNLISELKSYQSNNRGALPTDMAYVSGSAFDACSETDTSGCSAYANAGNTTWRGFYRDYLGAKFFDPAGEHYSLSIVDCSSTATDKKCTDAKLAALYESRFPYGNYDIVMAIGATCAGGEAVGSSNPRTAAAVYKMEGTGSFCANT